MVARKFQKGNKLCWYAFYERDCLGLEVTIIIIVSRRAIFLPGEIFGLSVHREMSLNKGHPVKSALYKKEISATSGLQLFKRGERIRAAQV